MKKLIVLCLLAAPLAVFAAEKVVVQEIGQKDRTFSKSSISIKKGEKVKFVNDDSVTHNLFSQSKGAEFNVSQKPGESAERTFETTGEIEVRCAIHPKMKLVIKVSE